jgi:hypothetical protein
MGVSLSWRRPGSEVGSVQPKFGNRTVRTIRPRLVKVSFKHSHATERGNGRMISKSKVDWLATGFPAEPASGLGAQEMKTGKWQAFRPRIPLLSFIC